AKITVRPFVIPSGARDLLCVARSELRALHRRSLAVARDDNAWLGMTDDTQPLAMTEDCEQIGGRTAPLVGAGACAAIGLLECAKDYVMLQIQGGERPLLSVLRDN